MPGGGCPTCQQHFCYVCQRRRPRDNSTCGCKLFCDDDGVLTNISVKAGYRFDLRCGCIFCNECRPRQPCAQCDGQCVVCQGIVQPNGL
jgi:hypothetical protein